MAVLDLSSGRSISDGDPFLVNFGTANVGDVTSRDFSIINTGTAGLILTSLFLPTGFSSSGFYPCLAQFFPCPIQPGETDSLSIRVNTTAPGTYGGTVQFSTNVVGKELFSFSIQATVVVV